MRRPIFLKSRRCDIDPFVQSIKPNTITDENKKSITHYDSGQQGASNPYNMRIKPEQAGDHKEHSKKTYKLSIRIDYMPISIVVCTFACACVNHIAIDKGADIDISRIGTIHLGQSINLSLKDISCSTTINATASRENRMSMVCL